MYPAVGLHVALQNLQSFCNCYKWHSKRKLRRICDEFSVPLHMTCLHFTYTVRLSSWSTFFGTNSQPTTSPYTTCLPLIWNKRVHACKPFQDPGQSFCQTRSARTIKKFTNIQSVALPQVMKDWFIWCIVRAWDTWGRSVSACQCTSFMDICRHWLS